MTRSASLAAQLMAERKIDALPVVLEGRVVGLVTSTDLVVLLAEQAPVCSLPFDFRVRETAMIA